MTKITAIIPTLNEEERIQNSLKSAEFADEVIVIDSYSTDKTVEIVKCNWIRLSMGSKHYQTLQIDRPKVTCIFARTLLIQEKH